MTGPDRPVPEADPVPVIVQTVGEEHALVLGPAGMLGEWGSQEQSLAPTLVDVVNGLAMTAPSPQGMVTEFGGGLLRLTPEAKVLLAKYGPTMTDGGGVMGVVRGADGQFKGLLLFQEVSNLTSVAANLPTLMASLALQAQLSVIERKLDAIQGDVATIIRDGRIEMLAEARAVLDIVGDVYSEVAASGSITEDDWDRVGPLELPIRTLHFQAKAQ